MIRGETIITSDVASGCAWPYTLVDPIDPALNRETRRKWARRGTYVGTHPGADPNDPLVVFPSSRLVEAKRQEEDRARHRPTEPPMHRRR